MTMESAHFRAYLQGANNIRSVFCFAVTMAMFSLVFLLCITSGWGQFDDDEDLFMMLNNTITEEVIIDSAEINAIIQANPDQDNPNPHKLLNRSVHAKSSITCTLKRFENVYYFGTMSDIAENVTEPSCAYLCWKRRTKSEKCSSVNYLRPKRKCEFMQDSLQSQNTYMNYLAQPDQQSIYVIPMKCSDAIDSTVSDPTSAPNSFLQPNGWSLSKGQCGQSQITSRFSGFPHRIVGGVTARPHSHPWVVSLQTKSKIHFCGGTLLRVNENQEKSDIVVTAAHCVQRVSSGWQVGLGLHSLKKSTSNEKRIRVKKHAIHRGYGSRSQQNDIAILVLEEPVEFTSTIQPICLPNQGQSVPESSSMNVVGWGDRREGGSSATELMEVMVPVVASDTCTSNYASTGVHIVANLMLCAGVQGKDSCQGDSGGPLMLKSGNTYVLHGIVSFGDGCARKRKPGVYTRVSSYVNWINDQIKSLSSIRR